MNQNPAGLVAAQPARGQNVAGGRRTMKSVLMCIAASLTSLINGSQPLCFRALEGVDFASVIVGRTCSLMGRRSFMVNLTSVIAGRARSLLGHRRARARGSVDPQLNSLMGHRGIIELHTGSLMGQGRVSAR